MDDEAVDDLRPERHLVAVDHDRRQQPDRDHLQQILVLQVLVGGGDLDLVLAGRPALPVELGQVLVIAGGPPDVDRGLGREPVEARNLAGRRTGHQQLADPGQQRVGEIDQRPPFRRDRQIGGGDVAAAFDQRRQELVARHRDDHHLNVVFLAQRLIDVLLERLEEVVGDAPLLGTVEEVHGLAENGEHADRLPLDHLVEIGGRGFLNVLEDRRTGLVSARRRDRRRGQRHEHQPNRQPSAHRPPP